MQFRWPFQHKDEAALNVARTELASAEAALDTARAVYLRLQDSRQTAKLRLQQSVLDNALHRYHAARWSVRALERQDLVPAPWARQSALRSAPLTKA
jgi:hypothetical protein